MKNTLAAFALTKNVCFYDLLCSVNCEIPTCRPSISSVCFNPAVGGSIRIAASAGRYHRQRVTVLTGWCTLCGPPSVQAA